jgi:L-alanine-DL-glutamate epimerase-like enolase superfamily enzyme
VRLSFERRTLRLAQPLRTSYGEISERELLHVTLTGEDGLSGHGEAAPLEPYDGVSLARVEAALESYRPILAGAGAADVGAGPSGIASILAACRGACDLPQALAAIDLALWDMSGRGAGRPVAELLAERPARSLAVNATISALDRATAAREAAEAVGRGFPCLKMKVGVGDDAGRVAAVRAAGGPRVALRLDANGAWDVSEAVSSIEALAPAGLELVEEPVHGLAAVRSLRERVSVRVAIDETAAERGALSAGAADAVCLKISRCGGISGLLAAAALVRDSGAEVYLGSTYDGPLGIAAALHAGAALAARGQLAPSGLATLALFDGLAEMLPVIEGRIAVPPGPGLGVEPP